MKNSIFLLLGFLFLLISLVYIKPATQKKQQSHIRSENLKKEINKNEYEERIDYLDSSGKITIADDLGYATIIITKKDKGFLEQYYDDKGKPIAKYAGNYAVFREYDDKGNNIRNTLLDLECHPMMTNEGYAIEERKYNKKRQLVVVKYYDTEGAPVLSTYYGYGKINEYDDKGRNIKTTYIDQTGHPMLTASQGYACIIHQFYDDGNESGKKEYEYYFDDQERPIALSLGQYGIQKEYDKNGLESKITYLDAGGKPIITNKGYTTKVCTYHADNSIAAEQYYDIEGKPFSLLDGQYGIKNTDGNTVYLDANGKEILNLRTLLYNYAFLIPLIAFITVIISALLSRKWNIVFLILYICVVLYLTLLFREKSDIKKTEFLWFYRNIFISKDARSDILKNIWLFIPLGAIIYQLFPYKKVLFVSVILSLFIEGFQYILGIGICELDDVISNSLGGCMGYYLSKLTKDILQRINKCKRITL